MTQNPFLLICNHSTSSESGDLSVFSTLLTHNSREGFSVMIAKGDGARKATEFFKAEVEGIARKQPAVFNPTEEAWKAVGSKCSATPGLTLFEADMMGGWFMERTTDKAAWGKGKSCPMTSCRLSFLSGGSEARMSTPFGYPGVSVHDMEMFLFSSSPMSGKKESLLDLQRNCQDFYRTALGLPLNAENVRGAVSSQFGQDDSTVIALDLRAVLRDLDLQEATPSFSERMPLLIKEEGNREDINGRTTSLRGGEHRLPEGAYFSRLRLFDVRYCPIGEEEISVLIHPREAEGPQNDRTLRLRKGESASIRLGVKGESDREGISWWSDLYSANIEWKA